MKNTEAQICEVDSPSAHSLQVMESGVETCTFCQDSDSKEMAH